ncbi:MAG: type II toxin-antitoxin system Phd/YefM family antitoxin [Deltaproteobacteria bacterium]|nr:type II toxin-antitoxin system Phd/YefM family antitoxin [Deltaproteobacteria bacterium]
MKTMPLSEVKMKLSALLEDVASRDEEIMITRNGKTVAVMVSPEEFESLQETLAIRADKALMKEIRMGLKGLKRGHKTYTIDELLGPEA